MSLTPEFNCYVDESGDEGYQFGKGSSAWFFVSAVIVNAEDDREVRGTVDELRQEIWVSRGKTPPAVLHWYKLKHKHKIVVARKLGQQPYCQIAVGIWKKRLDRTAKIAASPDYLYRHAVRFLLERVTWYVSERKGELGKIVFSSRSRLRKDRLQEYLQLVLDTPGAQVKPVFDVEQVSVSTPAQMRMLQIADACAGAVGNAFNPDDFANTHPYYLSLVKGNLYRRNGKLISYGLKLFPKRYPIADYEFLAGLKA